MQYVLHEADDMAVTEFIDQDTRASFTFRIPMRDLEHFIRRRKT